jgi:hypothetical protein
MHAAEFQKDLAVEMEFVGQRSEDWEDLLAAVGLITCLHRSVGREYKMVANAFEGVA